MMKYFLTQEALDLGIEFKQPREGDAGYDIPALENCIVAVHSSYLVPTGIHLAIPHGYVGLVRDRSGQAIKGLGTLAGVIDSSYRGELKILVHNYSSEPKSIKVGERIAQLLVIPHLSLELQKVTSLEILGESERGVGGFGSTGY